MGNPITLTNTGLAVTTANDLMQITIADDKPITIVGFTVVQSSDVGDAAEEVLRYGLYSGVTTGATGGTAATASTLDVVSGATVSTTGHSNWTTPSTGGTLRLIGGFNIRVGEALWLPPEVMPRIGQGASPCSFRLLAAPADSVTLDICVYIIEG